jgi:hypothetical protein
MCLAGTHFTIITPSTTACVGAQIAIFCWCTHKGAVQRQVKAWLPRRQLLCQQRALKAADILSRKLAARILHGWHQCVQRRRHVAQHLHGFAENFSTGHAYRLLPLFDGVHPSHFLSLPGSLGIVAAVSGMAPMTVDSRCGHGLEPSCVSAGSDVWHKEGRYAYAAAWHAWRQHVASFIAWARLTHCRHSANKALALHASCNTEGQARI